MRAAFNTGLKNRQEESGLVKTLCCRQQFPLSITVANKYLCARSGHSLIKLSEQSIRAMKI